jgi:hypothetical protein
MYVKAFEILKTLKPIFAIHLFPLTWHQRKPTLEFSNKNFLFTVLGPVWESFTQTETSSLMMKGCNILAYAWHSGFLSRGIFNVLPRLLGHGASVFPVSSKGPFHLVATFHTPSQKGMLRTYSNPEPHGIPIHDTIFQSILWRPLYVCGGCSNTLTNSLKPLKFLKSWSMARYGLKYVKTL